MFSFLLFLLLAIGTAADLVQHDESWVPDYVLRGTAENITIACESRHSAIINGSMPAPPLHLKEGEVTWIRVYNDMEEHNLTIVRFQSSSAVSSTKLTCHSTGTV